MANGKLQSTSWRDVKGNIARVRFFIDSTLTDALAHTAASTVINAIATVTNSAFQSASGPATSVAGPVAYGTAAQFATVEDKAVLTFSAADGSLHRYQIPAPKIGIFEVDQETIDAGNADVGTLVTAIVGNAKTSAGASLSSYVGGIRVRRKLHRKLNIFLKVPELDEIAE